MTQTDRPGDQDPALWRLGEMAAARLHRWLLANGWAGYDPYDVRGLRRFVHAASSTARLERALVLRLDRWFPLAVRRSLGVERVVNAKAMALFAEGYRRLYVATGLTPYLSRATEALAWLEHHPASGYSGHCWGYPFDWQSRILIPRGTPSAVVSATAGEAFWGFYGMTGEQRYLDICASICRFFLRDLHRDRVAAGVCFSYTPLDRFHVHNANLKVAHLLAQVGRETQDAEMLAAARDAVSYTLGQQNDDGSICYWGEERGDRCHIDHYHTGFELRSLHGFWEASGDVEVHRAFGAYYDFYVRHLFTREGAPKGTPLRLYPVDIHSCAEALLCHAMLAPAEPRSRAALPRLLAWVLSRMQLPDGSFRYMIRKAGPARWRLNIPYMRWGQAWMLRALAEVLLLLKDEKQPAHS